MKKALSFLLIATLLLSMLSLVGCGKKENEEIKDAQTEIVQQDTAPEVVEPEAETVDWENFTLGISTGSLSDSMMLAICSGVAEYFEELGATTSTVECNFVPNVQLEQLENFVVMGVDAIYCLSLNSAILEDVTTDALSKDIKVIFGGAAPAFLCTASHNTDNKAVGEALGKMAIAWLDEVYPDAADGSVHAAAFVSLDIEDLRVRGEAMIETLEADPRVQFTYTKEGIMVINEGFDAAEEAMTADKDIRIFAAFNDNTALGASNYLMSANISDLDKYAVFGAAISEITQDAVDSTAEGEGVLRGLIGYGTINPADGAIDCIYKAVTGEYEQGYCAWDKIYSYNSFGFGL